MPTSCWPATAQAVLLYWWIDAVFAAVSGGRSIYQYCTALWTYAMSAARSEEWTGVLAVALSTVDRVGRVPSSGVNLEARLP